MGGIGGSLTKGLSYPISPGFSGGATYLVGDGEDSPLLLGCALPLLLLIIFSSVDQTIVVLPLLITPPLLLLVNGASVISSVGWVGPPIGIDAQRGRRIQEVHIRPQPKDGGHVGGLLLHEILYVPHLPQVSCQCLFMGQFQAQNFASNATPLNLLHPIL